MEYRFSDKIASLKPSAIREVLKATSVPGMIPFAAGNPAPDAFPVAEVQEIAADILKNRPIDALQYGVTEGYPELISLIKTRIKSKYGIGRDFDSIIITSGAQQVMDLSTKVLCNEGDVVICESPSFIGSLNCFRSYNAKLVGVPMEDDGVDLTVLEHVLKTQSPRMFYCIPNFQNPTGLTYTAENREKVRAALASRNIVVVEDDPYGELRFEGESLPYIGGTALPHGVVMGSFSKTVTPGFRMGYLLTKDHDLLRALNTAKEAADLHTNVFAQFVVLDYLRHNDLDEHLVKIRELYRTQARAMTDAMAEFFPAEVSFTKPQGGMFLWATLPEGLNTMDLFPKALERNVAFVPGEPFYAQPGAYSTMRLNFTNADADTIRDGIQRLGEVIAAAL